tara:strand:- start:3070 stop:4107 length:1038 start_codon:yes stop_codon:yes gene_type:complete
MIPIETSQMTSDWLSHVLGIQVTDSRLVEANSGTTGRAVIEVEYGEPSNLPRKIFIKHPPADEQQRAFVSAIGMGVREVEYYRHLSAESPVRVPHCYYADHDDNGAQYIMVLEHLEESGCTFRNASSRYSLDYVRSILDAFARLHAKYWQSERFQTDLKWVEPFLHHEITSVLIEKALTNYGDQLPSVFSEMAELYLANPSGVHALWTVGPQTLVHGDVHDGNMFFDGDEPGFLDWAVVARGPAMRDVGYFLGGTLTAEDQEKHGAQLVDYYRDRLRDNGISTSSGDDLYSQYQWHIAYVWLSTTVTLAMDGAWQPNNYLLSALKKVHAAMEAQAVVPALKSALA